MSMSLFNMDRSLCIIETKLATKLHVPPPRTPLTCRLNYFFWPLSDSQSLTQKSLAAEMVKKGLPAPTSFAAGATQSTCFTKYKKRISKKKCRGATDSTQFTCCTSKQVQILTIEELQRCGRMSRSLQRQSCKCPTHRQIKESNRKVTSSNFN